jgi:polysaccharide export outer membrane protein
MRSQTRSAICSIALGILVAGCASTTAMSHLKVDVQVIDALRRYELAYLLQAGDQIEVFVYRHPEFSRKSVVRHDGAISLPLLGDVNAAGKSPKELARELTELFGTRLKNPEVTVIVENPPEPMVYVLGEVGVPKGVALRQARTAAQALAQSGIVTKAAALYSVSVVRLSREGVLEAHTIQSDGASQPEVYMALQNMALMPNDLIVVPESYRGQVVRAITDFNTIIQPYFQYKVLFEFAK